MQGGQPARSAEAGRARIDSDTCPAGRQPGPSGAGRSAHGGRRASLSAVLLYVDPPYVQSTRSGGSRYRFDMTEADHVDLVTALRGCTATVVLSGYESGLYAEHLGDWRRTEIQAGTGQGSVWKDRTEVLWSNRPLNDAPSLFDHEHAGVPS